MTKAVLDKRIFLVDSIPDIDVYQEFNVTNIGTLYNIGDSEKGTISFEFRIWSFAQNGSNSFVGSGSQGNMYILDPIVLRKAGTGVWIDAGAEPGSFQHTVQAGINHIRGSNDHLYGFRALVNTPSNGSVTFSLLSATSSDPSDPAATGWDIRYMLELSTSIAIDT